MLRAPNPREPARPPLTRRRKVTISPDTATLVHQRRSQSSSSCARQGGPPPQPPYLFPLSCTRVVVQTWRGPGQEHVRSHGFRETTSDFCGQDKRVDTSAGVLIFPGESVASADGLWSGQHHLQQQLPSRSKPSARTGLTMVASTAS